MKGKTAPLRRTIRLAAGYQLRMGPAGSESRLLSPKGSIQVNETAATILDLCNGKHTAEEIVKDREEIKQKTLESALGDGSELSSKALLVATGVSYRYLDVPGATPLTGAGIYYGASTAEASSCDSDDHVYVVGAGNSAGQAAVQLSQYASTVTMLVRGEGLGATMSRCWASHPAPPASPRRPCIFTAIC